MCSEVEVRTSDVSAPFLKLWWTPCIIPHHYTHPGEKSWKEGPFAVPGRVTKAAANRTFNPMEKNDTRAIYNSPNKPQNSSANTPGAARFTGNMKNGSIKDKCSGMNYPHCKEMLKILSAGRLSGDITLQEENQIFLEVSMKEIGMKLLYVTPEKISASQKFINLSQRLYTLRKLSRFVINEAHCVSDWGHDLRPDYKKLSILQQRFFGVPIMALTATATPRVRVDIIHLLGLEDNTKWT